MARTRSALAFVTLCFLLVYRPAAASWEDCKTTKMVLKNGYMINTIEVLATSRLGGGQSVADCMKKCRVNQECYSFNYNKLTKWCYIGSTEILAGSLSKNSKMAAGYRTCVAHSDGAAWGNGEFTSGTAEPSGPVSGVTAVDNISTGNILTVSFTSPSNAGVSGDGSAATIVSYKVTCSPTSGTGATITKMYTPTEASCIPPSDTSCTVDVSGLSSIEYRCSVIVTNSAYVESTATYAPPVQACSANLSSCKGSCISYVADDNNCGSCGNVCPVGKACLNSQCGCPATETLCSGVCKTTQTDNSNCGACGTVCSGGKVCSAGVCSCPAGTSLCSGSCIDTQSSSTNCGACSNSCGIGGSCTAGSCTCGAGYYLSGTSCAACSVTCATCSGGTSSDCTSCAGGGVLDATTNTCACPTGYFWSGQYGKCVQNAINQCSANDCKNYDAVSNTCPSSKADGTACSTNGGSVCVNGYCSYSCSFFSDCPDKHTTTGTCSMLSGQTVCNYGSTCVSGWTNLNGVLTDGCEYQSAAGIAGLTVFQNCGGTGWSINLSIGAYTLNPTTQADASQVVVPAGYRVYLYKAEDLKCTGFAACNCPYMVDGGTTGATVNFCDLNPCGGGNYNDRVRSIFVEKI